MFARALSAELNARGFRSILCFPSLPVPVVGEFLDLPNTVVISDPGVFDKNPFQSGWSFARLLRHHPCSIVHLHFMGLVSPLPWVARLSGVTNLFFTNHGSQPEAGLSASLPLWKRWAKTLIHNPVKRFIAVSEYVRQSHIAPGQIPASRFSLIYNGIDIDRVDAAMAQPGGHFRQRFSIPADAMLVTQVSWMIEEKGVRDLLEAAALLLPHSPRVHFCIVGEGPCLDEYIREADRLGITPHCTFTGQIMDPFFEEVFVASDVICQPSRWQEAFGWVIGEAMAFGKPVIATRTGGIPELIDDGVTGFLVERRHPAELAQRLQDLLADPGLRIRMGHAARKSVCEHFSLQRNIQEHLDLYGI